jgi:pimeloyl-ACP methyl ester carboxylesterase
MGQISVKIPGQFSVTINSVKGQTEDTLNREMTMRDLMTVPALKRTLVGGKILDNPVTRRIRDGYRVLIVSYCDHDLYAGQGTRYRNNPRGGEVNGLEASVAAIKYVGRNYPTTQIFTHGTSAGATGAFLAAMQLHSEGINITGVVADSHVASARHADIIDRLKGARGFPFGPNYQREGVEYKLSIQADDPNYAADNVISQGFRAVPMLFIYGTQDRFCGGNSAAIPQARADGFRNNCRWSAAPILQAIERQRNSPHQVVFLNTGHVPSNGNAAGVNRVVGRFISQTTSRSSHNPF